MKLYIEIIYFCNRRRFDSNTVFKALEITLKVRKRSKNGDSERCIRNAYFEHFESFKGGITTETLAVVIYIQT